MIVPGLALAILSVLVVVIAGGFLLRIAGRIAVLAGLLGAVFGGGPLGFLIAATGGRCWRSGAPGR